MIDLDNEEVSVNLEEVVSTGTSGKGKRWSKVWDEFDYTAANKTESGIAEGKCKHCHGVFSAVGHNGTSNMRRHLVKYPGRKNHDIS